MPPRLLLVAPPWRLPYTASLALGTLTPIIRDLGHEVDELHGTVLFPQTASTFDVIEGYAKYLFVRSYNDTPVDELLESFLRFLSTNATARGDRVEEAEQSWASVGLEEKSMKERFLQDLTSAERCHAIMAERALDRDYDIVGFSATFDSQVPAALALARHIKRRRPEVKIVLGGAACFEEQADGLLSSFPDLDVVCHTEGESVIGPLIAALRGRAELADVPGIAWRSNSGVVHNPSPPLLTDLDTLPIPDYSGFIDEFENSPWAAAYKPVLMFETSRGCWWGQKKFCTFCGLNGEGLSFRSKTPERAYDEITRLYHDYPSANYFQATDNILDMKYLSTVFPRLKELASARQRPLRMFYEVKSNMKLAQIEAMAAAGVDCVQPGIESFSDDILELMNKGCTALGQIQFIKWSYQEKIEPKYNILIGNPGEQAAWYDDMTALIPFLVHLPPPTGIVNMQLERFSPYFQNPGSYGIHNIRPQAFYKELYPGDGVDHRRIAYQFDFDHPDHHNPELIAATRRFLERAQAWRVNWAPDCAYYMADDPALPSLLIVDKRDLDESVSMLAGVQARLFLYLDQFRSRAQIARQFPGLDATLVDTLLLTWGFRRWVCRVGDRFLSVLPRRGPAIPMEWKRAPRESLPMVAA